MIQEEKIVKRIDELIEKGNVVIATHKPNPASVIAPSLDAGAFEEWKSQVQSFLINLIGESHVYNRNFYEKVKTRSKTHVNMGQGILRAVKEDILGGYLRDVKTLLSAEVFTDFLEMAEHLLECGYKDPAASLGGAVLENGLQKIANNHEITIKSKEDLSSLNHKCADGDVYNRLVQKKIQVWNDIRNNADHGKFNEYSGQDVEDMLKGVQQFLMDLLK